jgi:putative Mg2+ transporter-C (MgtC) family protein
VSVIVRLFLAILLSGLIGMERSKVGRAAGLRTHILVCLGATIASMTGLYINSYYGSGDATRIAAQVISGISFLGAGTILVKNKSIVTGLTTSACIWVVGTIGIAVGYGFYEAAVLGAFLIFFITKAFSSLDTKLRHNMKEVLIYVEFISSKSLNETLSKMKNLGIEIENVKLVQSKTHIQDGIGADMVIHVNKNKYVDDLMEQINDLDNVKFSIVTSW